MEEQTVKTPAIRSANILYLILMLMFVVGGEVTKRIAPPSLSYAPKMAVLFLTQLVLVFAPLAIFIYLTKVDVKRTLRLNKISIGNLLLSSGIMLFAIPLTTFINFIFILILKYFGKVHAAPEFPSQNLFQLMVALFVVAVTPALFEELIFRGVVMRSYERIGRTGAIVVSALLFALLHRDLQSLVGTFLLGLVIAYIVYRTDSIFGGVAAHFTNNGFIVLITYVILKLQENIKTNYPNLADQIKEPAKGVDAFSSIPMEQLAALFVFLAVVAAIFSVGFIALLLLLNYNTKNIDKTIVVSEAERPGKLAYLPLILSFSLVIYEYVKQLS